MLARLKEGIKRKTQQVQAEELLSVKDTDPQPEASVLNLLDESVEEIQFTKEKENQESIGSSPEVCHMNFTTTQEDIDFENASAEFSDQEDSYEYELREIDRYEQHEREVARVKGLAADESEYSERSQEQKSLSKDGDVTDGSFSLKKPMVRAEGGEHEDEDQKEEQELWAKKDRIVSRRREESSFDALTSGTSATLVIQINRAPKRLFVAWVGDSKCMVAGGSEEEVDIIDMEDPKAEMRASGIEGRIQSIKAHSPDDKKEKYRIYSQSGEVREMRDGRPRVCMRGRLFPALRTTRSIGDLVAH